MTSLTFKKRIETLEAVPRPARAQTAGKPLELADLLAKLDQEKADYDALDAAGRIRHWENEIAEAEARTARGVDHAGEDDNFDDSLSVRLLRSFREDELRDLTEELASSFPWSLLEARLDRLHELGYDRTKIDQWRIVHERFRDITWQWRPKYLELPADPLELIESRRA